MTTGSRDVSSLVLERYRAGDLPEQEFRFVKDRLVVDDELRRRFEELEASDRTILGAVPPAEFARLVRARASQPDPSRNDSGSIASLSFARFPLALAAMVVVALGLVPAMQPPEMTAAPSVDRTKGASLEILVFRRTASGTAERLSSGDLANEGDLIQLAYRAPGRAYGVLVSVDGRGAVTQHFPASGNEAGRLSGPGTIALEAAYRLDAAPRFERFFLVTSNEPFSAGSVVDAARASASRALAIEALPLPGRVQTSFLLRKDLR